MWFGSHWFQKPLLKNPNSRFQFSRLNIVFSVKTQIYIPRSVSWPSRTFLSSTPGPSPSSSDRWCIHSREVEAPIDERDTEEQGQEWSSGKHSHPFPGDGLHGCISQLPTTSGCGAALPRAFGLIIIRMKSTKKLSEVLGSASATSVSIVRLLKSGPIWPLFTALTLTNLLIALDKSRWHSMLIQRPLFLFHPTSCEISSISPSEPRSVTKSLLF
jgi:hypothetical protein